MIRIITTALLWGGLLISNSALSAADNEDIINAGRTLEETIALSEQNPSIKAAMQNVKVYASLHDAAKSGHYPSLDLSYGGTYLYEEPVVYIKSSITGLAQGSAQPVQAQKH